MNNSIVQAYRVDCVILKEENTDDCSSRHDLHVVERSRGESSKPQGFQTLNNGANIVSADPCLLFHSWPFLGLSS